MNKNAYLENARNLLRAPATGGQRQVNLRCALDSIYIGVLQFLAASCADAIIGEHDCGSEPSAWRTVYRAALRSADESGLSNVDTSWLAPPVAEFAAGFAQLHTHRGIMEREPGMMVGEQDVLDALELADLSIRQLGSCDADEVTEFAVAVTLPN